MTWSWLVERWDKYPNQLLLRGELVQKNEAGEAQQQETSFLGIPLWEAQSWITVLDNECKRRNGGKAP